MPWFAIHQFGEKYRYKRDVLRTGLPIPKELGFSQADTSSATSHVGTNVVNLAPPMTFYIDIHHNYL
jgi:hypothetical protein